MNPRLKSNSRMLTIIVSVAVAALAIFFEERRISDLEEESSSWSELLVAMRDCNTGIVIIRVGEDRIAKANKDAEELFGYKNGELLGLPVSEIVPEEFMPEHKRAYERTMETAATTLETRVVPISCLAKKKDGTTVPVIIRLYIGKGGIVALINHNKTSKYLKMDGVAFRVGNAEDTTSKTEPK